MNQAAGERIGYFLWSKGLAVMACLTVLLLLFNPTDSAHPQTIFLRAGVVFLETVIFLVKHIYIRRFRAGLARQPQEKSFSASRVLGQIPEGDAIQWSVRAPSTPRSYWRSNLYLLWHRRQMFSAILLPPLIVALLVAVPIAAVWPLTGLKVALGLLLSWLLFLAGCLWQQMVRDYARTGPKYVSEIALTCMGYRDITLSTTVFVPWSDVVAIDEDRSDVYLWREGGQANYITRNAFRDRVEARAFYHKALELWRNPMPLPEDQEEVQHITEGVWPPPPRV